MDEAWRLFVSDAHASPALVFLVLLPVAVSVVPLVLRAPKAGVPLAVLVIQAAVWYGYHLMGGWSGLDGYHPLVQAAVAVPSAASLVVAVVSLVRATRRLAHAHHPLTRPRPPRAGTP